MAFSFGFVCKSIQRDDTAWGGGGGGHFPAKIGLQKNFEARRKNSKILCCFLSFIEYFLRQLHSPLSSLNLTKVLHSEIADRVTSQPGGPSLIKVTGSPTSRLLPRVEQQLKRPSRVHDMSFSTH